MFVDRWALSVLPDRGYLGGGFEKGSAFMIFLEISAILCHGTSVVVKWASTPLTNTSIWARDLDAGKKNCGIDDFLRLFIPQSRDYVWETDPCKCRCRCPQNRWSLFSVHPFQILRPDGSLMMIEGIIMAFIMMMTTFECLARFFPEWNIMFPRAQVIWRLA